MNVTTRTSLAVSVDVTESGLLAAGGMSALNVNHEPAKLLAELLAACQVAVVKCKSNFVFLLGIHTQRYFYSNKKHVKVIFLNNMAAKRKLDVIQRSSTEDNGLRNLFLSQYMFESRANYTLTFFNEQMIS